MSQKKNELKKTVNFAQRDFQPIKKLDSSILERIEKKSSLGISSRISVHQKKINLKEMEQQELEKIEKYTTFNKIKKLQNLLKEMISMKKRFEINKDKIIDKINKNCFNYYNNKIKMKEIYDYCQSNKIEKYINYILIKEPEKYLGNKHKNILDDIYRFIFLLRNNNKLVIKLIDNCENNDYKNICDFLINFFYEDTINSSFIQEELMLIIYLIFEKNILEKLPSEILTNKGEYSYDIFRNEKNIVYFILKSLSRKADVRNFLCSILVDAFNKLQGNRKYLSTYDIFNSKNLEEEDIPMIENNDDSASNVDTITKRYTMKDINIVNKLNFKKGENTNNELQRISTRIKEKHSVDNIILPKDDFYKDNNRNNDNEDNNNGNNNNNENNINNNENNINNNDLFILPENISEEDLKKINLDSFFDDNNISLDLCKNKLKEYEHFSKNNNLNLALKDYLNSLIKDINDAKEEIYSNRKIVNFLKSIKIKMNEEEKKEKKEKNEKESFDKMIEMIKTNYFSIIEIIDDIINKLKENITSVPVIIKCISNIIENFLNKKYIEKKHNLLINNFQQYLFQSNFFIGNIILSALLNPDYNGTFTSDVISKTTVENLKIIYNILDKLLSGKLFTYGFYILYNKYIIETIPKIFEIIDNIEKNFKLPDVLERLVNTCTDVNNKKRLSDFEYDYFFEKNEEVRYQSACFNMKTLCLLIKLVKKMGGKTGDDGDEKLFEKIFTYEKYLNNLYDKDLKEKKIQYIYLTKIYFNNKTENRINIILRDNFIGVPQSQNNNDFTYFKKCLTEILGYANIINEESFNYFTYNMKQSIHQYDINNIIFKKKKKLIYDNIVNEKEYKEENKYQLSFEDSLFPKILEYLKYEIGKNIDDPKAQRIIFCTLYIQTHLQYIPNEYIQNNYSKLFMELIKETNAILNIINSNILNQMHNKIKEGTKLNLIITSNYLQTKSLEKFKVIEYLYSKIIMPNKFKIDIDDNGLVKKIEYLGKKENDDKKKLNKDKDKDKEKDNKEILNDFVIVDKDLKTEEVPERPKYKRELIKKIINVIPDFRKFEESTDDIIKKEEELGLPNVLKKFFRNLKNAVKKQEIIKRFTIDEVDSISVELENYILFKLYDKIYPTKSSKEDIKFYKKCCRLNFIKPENLITDRNIYNEKLWKISIDYINEINNKYTPQDKLKTILKAFNILQNSISFSSGKKELGVDDTIKPLIYVLIKSKPTNIYSNYYFCQLFLSESLGKTQYGILLTQIFMIIRIIKDMKYNELMGVTEEEFGKDEDI